MNSLEKLNELTKPYQHYLKDFKGDSMEQSFEVIKWALQQQIEHIKNRDKRVKNV